MTPRAERVVLPGGEPPGPRELARLRRLLRHESSLLRQGYERIAGIDEAGRGPLAGPVVACALVIKPGILIPGVDDSKKLSSQKRERLSDLILEHAIRVSVSVVDVELIDVLNIRGAALRAMQLALEGLGEAAQYALIDGPRFPGIGIPHDFVIGGDAKCYSIAAASILAKVTRDRIMRSLDLDFPGYGFLRNKGYPTKGHKEALKRRGPTPVHRMSFPSVKKLIDGTVPSWYIVG
jgi:ribonuclease HII